MRLLLHACCGPCSLEPTRQFTEEGMDYSIAYINPNIHPQEEYQRRLDALKEYVAEPAGTKVFEGSYDVEEWEENVGIHGFDRESRCRACYRLRFQHLCQLALDEGYDAVCTTLTISPYQYTDVILQELQAAAESCGLKAVLEDFRSFYPEATRRSKRLGMYRQNYCGCRFSIGEAALEREQAAQQRKKARDLKRRALITAAAEGSANQMNVL